MRNKWLITVKGNDTFVYDCELTGTIKEVLAKCNTLLENLFKLTIEQMVDIQITKL